MCLDNLCAEGCSVKENPRGGVDVFRTTDEETIHNGLGSVWRTHRVSARV
jgi:hypothetical protein